MSLPDVLFWVIFPYSAFAIFVVGHVWRYRRGQFTWTSRSSQLLDRRILGWASPVFHYGALAAIAGHVIGMCIPESAWDSIGFTENGYRWFAGIPGGLAGVASVIGFGGLLYRRLTSDRVRRTTSTMDMLTYFLLTVLIVMGTWMTLGYTLFTDDPTNYRRTISPWWQSLFWLHPDVDAATSAPFVYQLHAVLSWLFWAAYPFSRLVHAWSIPLQYLGRPYILYRRRYGPVQGR